MFDTYLLNEIETTSTVLSFSLGRKVINDFVKSWSIKIETPKKVLNVNETIRIKTTIKPANATNQVVSWSSSNEEVAIVDNGIVRAVAEGNADITATINGMTSTVQIIVKEKRIK